MYFSSAPPAAVARLFRFFGCYSFVPLIAVLLLLMVLLLLFYNWRSDLALLTQPFSAALLLPPF